MGSLATSWQRVPAAAILALGAALLFGLPAQGSAAATSAAPRGAALPQAAHVRLGVVGIVAGAGYYLAIEKGYFAEQGLDVEAIPFATTADETAPLAAGQLDVGAGATSAGLFNAIARGVDIKLVADEGHTEAGRPGSALVVRRAAADAGQLRDVADLRGRRIAIASTSIGVVTDLRGYLARGGLTLDDVTLEQMAFPDMAPALGNGSVDAAIAVEPFLTVLQQTGLATRWLWDYEVNPDHQVAAILYGPGFVREQPEAARRWMTAYLRGVRYFNDAFVRGDAAAREETVQVLMKWTPIHDPALYDQMSVIGLDPDGELRVPSLAADQELFLALGQQDRPVDFTTAVDLQYVRAARQVLGPY
ncbi:MAG TPA: ABC transporter substrate-binding protein [Chloroflexota bacterium]|nr:ABC transporter substrate-binding protein [Chloroflexota bacterium]